MKVPFSIMDEEIETVALICSRSGKSDETLFTRDHTREYPCEHLYGCHTEVIRLQLTN
jgi:hypothetical protein